MKNPVKVLNLLNKGDHIRFQSSHYKIGEKEAEVVGKTSEGVKIRLTDHIKSGGTTVWIEYHEKINEDFPVLISTEGTSPDATIYRIAIE